MKHNFPGTKSPQRLNNLLCKQKGQYMDVITKLHEKDGLRFLTVMQLEARQVGPSSSASVFTIIEGLTKVLRAANRMGTARSYDNTIKTFKKFRKQRDLTFNEFNLEVLKKFETDYFSRGNTWGGYAFLMRTLTFRKLLCP